MTTSRVVQQNQDTRQAGMVNAAAGDARKTVGWFVILFLATLAWLQSAPGAYARGAPENLADLAEALSPAVVNISTEQVIRKTDGAAVPRGQLDRSWRKPAGGSPRSGDSLWILRSPIYFPVTDRHYTDKCNNC